MKIKSLAFVLVFFLIPTFCYSSVIDCLEATCVILKQVEAEVEITTTDKDGKVKKEKKKQLQLRVGTGILFHEDEKHVYILTAGHVVEGYKTLHTLFFKTGLPSPVMEVKVLLKKYKKDTIEDVAIVTVEKKAFGKYPIPKPIPLAAKGEEVKAKQRLISAGCPGGRWPNAFIGAAMIVGKDAYRFIPRPLKGRSGSGVFDEDGTKILGVIIWAGQMDGVAITTDYIYRLLGNNLPPKVKEPEKADEEEVEEPPKEPAISIELD